MALSSIGGLRSCRSLLLPHCAHEAEALARQCLDQPLLLAAVADGASRNVDAGRDCGIGDDAAVPDSGDEIILADDALAVADQVSEQVEHLRRDGHRLRPATQFPAVGVEHAILEQITQAVFLGRKQPSGATVARRKIGKKQVAVRKL
jgi:hypothetical protein